MKGFGLTDQQQQWYDFLTEFFDPNGERATGKTYVMACVIVKTAMENPGMKVYMIDHSDMTSRSMKIHGFMGRQVMDIVEGMPEETRWAFTFRKSDQSLVYDLSGFMIDRLDQAFHSYGKHKARGAPARVIMHPKDWDVICKEAKKWMASLADWDEKQYRGMRVLLSWDVERGEFLFS